MKAVIVNEKYLEERFEAFIDRVKVGYSENISLEKYQRDELSQIFVYHAHKFKDEILKEPYGNGK